MKIVIVVGARPNFMKAAPLLSAIRDHNKRIGPLERIECVLVHTGQHYDESMSGSFFSDLSLPQPDIQLGVGSGSHAVQTAEIMRRFEGILIGQRPDIVVVVGDVNSTVACALVTSKISFDEAGRRPLLAHVEAGLRSYDSAMPEEINRLLTDHLSDLLFVTEKSGLENLSKEGIRSEKVFFVGNTMIDSLLASKEKADQSTVLDRLGFRRNSNGTAGTMTRYALLTLHRPSNVDNRETFLSILEGLEEISNSWPILFSAHPRTQKRIQEFGLQRFFHFECETQLDQKRAVNTAGIHLLEPQGYLDFLCLMKHASLVVTDSGGIQEETTCLGVPCVTVRENTERPATITWGTNMIAGTRAENIRKTVNAQMNRRRGVIVPEKWDGHAAKRIIAAMVESFESKLSTSDVCASELRPALP
jgi:UDP-N-acetylglucosamine 2-epimerase (non-hydrolysing)